MIIQIIAAFIGTVLFSLLFNVSRKELFTCGSIGAFGWGIYLVIVALSQAPALGAIVATLIICITSQVLARVRKNPVTIYQIAGIIPLVPGIGMYNTLQSFVLKDYDVALIHFNDTMAVASSIAVGMLLITSINKVLLKHKKKAGSY